MLPDFGYALYAEFSDRSRTLVAWASDKRPLEDNAMAFIRPISDEIASWSIVASHRVTVVQQGDVPYDLLINDPELQPAAYADLSVLRQLRSC